MSSLSREKTVHGVITCMCDKSLCKFLDTQLLFLFAFFIAFLFALVSMQVKKLNYVVSLLILM